MTENQVVHAPLALVGMPMFVARAAHTDTGERDYTGGHHNGGFWLPKAWQKTPAVGAEDVANLLAGLGAADALCAVTGIVLDVLDVDAHKSGWESLAELETRLGGLPPVYAVVSTPSGGVHLYIRSVGVRSRDGILPGLDLKAGDNSGRGRGFVYAPPTQKLSKTTRQLVGYVWQTNRLADVLAPASEAELERLNALKTLVNTLRGETGGEDAPVVSRISSGAELTEAERQRVADYSTALLEGWRERFAAAADWPEGETDTLGRGWERLVADVTYELARLTVTPGSGVSEADAEAMLGRIIPTPIWDAVDVAAKWRHKQGQVASGLEPVYIPPTLLHRPGETPVVLAGESVATAPEPDTSSSAKPVSLVVPTSPPELPDLPSVFDPEGVVHPRDIASAALAAAYPRHRYSVTERCWYVREDGVGVEGSGLWRWRAMGDTAHEWARHILYELETRAPAGNKEGSAREHAQHARREQMSASGSRGGIAALMRDSAPSASNGAFRTEDVDNDRRILWAGGWPWDLRCPGGRISVAPDVDLLTVHEHSCTVMPAEDVETPKWDALLAAMFPAEEMRAFAVHLLGASVTGESDRILPFLHGTRGHAKTTLLELVAELLGTYAGPVEPTLLGSGDSSSLTFARMELRGLRLAWVDEGRPESSRGFERLKALVGAQTMRGARKGKDSVVFECTHTLWVTDNKDPSLTDPALADRIRALSVSMGRRSEISAAVKAIKRDLKGWVREEGPGVLAALILAAGRYLADRSVCDNPPNVMELLNTMTRDQDTILTWIDERCVADGWTPFSTLWANYREYAERMGVTRGLVGTATQFRSRLDQLGIEGSRTSSTRLRKLTLRRDPDYNGGVPWGPAAKELDPEDAGPEGSGVGDPSGNAAGKALVLDAENILKTAVKPGGTGKTNLNAEPETVENTKLSTETQTNFTLCDAIYGDADSITHGVKFEDEKPGRLTMWDFHDAPPIFERHSCVTRASWKSQHVICEDPHLTIRDFHDAPMTADDARILRKNGERHSLEPSVTTGDSKGGDAHDAQMGLQEVRTKKANLSTEKLGINTQLLESRIDPPESVIERHLSITETLSGFSLEAENPGVASVETRHDVRPVAWACVRGSTPEVITLEAAGEMLGRIDVLTVDVENSGMPPGHEHYKLKTVQLGDSGVAVILDAGNEEAMRLAAAQLDRAPTLTAHACQADLIPIGERTGADPERWVTKMLDTMVLAPLVDPGIRPKDPRGNSLLGLKALSAHMLAEPVTAVADEKRKQLFAANKWLTNVGPDTPPERNGWLCVPIDDPVMLTYAAADILDGAALAQALLERIEL